MYVGLIARENEKRVESFEELLNESNANVYLIKGTSAVNSFSSSNNSILQGLWNKIQSGRGGFVELNNVYDIISETNYVIVNFREAEYKLNSGASNLYIGKEKRIRLDGGIVMRKTLPKCIKDRISESIRLFFEGGLVEQLDKKYIYKIKLETQFSTNRKTLTSKSISLKDLYQTAVYLLFFASLCIVTFILELCYNYLCRPDN